MGGKGSVPEAPDLEAMAQASIESAKLWEGVAQDNLAWAKEQGEFGQNMLERIVDVQMPMMQEAWSNSQKDRARYEQVFQPIEDNLVKEFQSYDTDVRREAEAGSRMADTRAGFEAQRANALSRLEGYGVDPSMTRNSALDRSARLAEAAGTAQAGNQGRKYVEQMGRALRGEAINIGRGMPSQVAQSQGIVNQTAGGMSSNFAQNTGATAGALGGAAQYGNLGMQGYQQGANISGQNFQNQMQQYEMESAQAAAPFEMAAGLAGGAMGMFSFGSSPDFKEGVTNPKRSALESIMKTPSKEWEYKASTGMDDGMRHIGPMADEVRDNMGVGNGTAIPVPDMLGVHQEAIRELAAMVMEGKKGGDMKERGYAIPDDVVRRKGTEFFDRLIEKNQRREG